MRPTVVSGISGILLGTYWGRASQLNSSSPSQFECQYITYFGAVDLL